MLNFVKYPPPPPARVGGVELSLRDISYIVSCMCIRSFACTIDGKIIGMHNATDYTKESSYWLLCERRVVSKG